MAAAGGVSRVPTQQVHASRHRVQVRAPARQRRSAERTRHRLLRQHQGTMLLYSYTLAFSSRYHQRLEAGGESRIAIHFQFTNRGWFMCM